MLHEQPLAVLATAGCTTPYANLIAFAMAGDFRRLWFATPRQTRKYANLLADSRVALLIDNRSNNTGDFEHAVAVTVLGEARELADGDAALPRSLYLTRHPRLAGFLADPTTALFELTVERYLMVSSFQQVVEVDMRQTVCG
jgi:hypothetical protein